MTDRPEDKEQSDRWRAAWRQGLAYQGSVEAVFAILIAAGVGYWADQHFGTSPRYLLIGMVVGFSAFVMRLLRLGRQLQQRASDTEMTQSKDDE